MTDSVPTLDNSTFVVVGIGADGWDGLSPIARSELTSAQVIFGSSRQLALLPDIGVTTVAWRSPMSEHLDAVLTGSSEELARYRGPDGTGIHLLASGDPMFHGLGATIVAAVGAHRVQVIPTVSSASLACARLGWDLADVAVVSAVTADPEIVLTEISNARRLLVLARDDTTPARLAELLVAHGFGASPFTVLEQLAGPHERVRGARADSWDPATVVDPLNIIAIDCIGPRRSPLPGRDESAFEHDGQITKSVIRALTVCALAPSYRQTLWDIGSGSGSVAIEWLRAQPGGVVIAFERDMTRAERLRINARRHGVLGRVTVGGAVPDALVHAPTPDAVFIGGGLSPRVLDTAWAALRPGGRLVANAVTIETQAILADWHRMHRDSTESTLRRFAVETAEPLGGYLTWRPALPIVTWAGSKALDGTGTS
ncbi:precorrin-6y C5,15-methyltransferase (decarboxylating) subunit CbiE [Gordonia oryzae]|uniref:Precorrin-6y C5,15-methyltransferase (Decarboxylating) subunit CbiE n=1 Tax=Gordonia oryzae TaxID=2487349 RepID=A0A3N4H4G8_9ACTN|nr:precorrin-6y C5,15-methyltransferase (decarboxylating) subunit CbiE [Gordonia oryzae]RPA66281.1 precorrin-6y C5,15-methyltransferase (decarboxylating) subunit CbiE [Gordonia oryzae]